MLRVFLKSLLLSVLVFVAAYAAKPTTSLDTNWAPYQTQPALEAKAIAVSNFYVTMRDGVRVAVSLYLPKDLSSGDKLPTILQSTRYMRAYDLRWPFESREAPSETIRTFLGNGYTYVCVDSRGSGASFGRWPAPWAPDEVKDYGEICDWIVNQPWSDGKIGCRGISYDGTTAEMTATNVHPAIKAIAPEFALFDSYTDVAFPGGIVLSEFIRRWSDGNMAIDRDEVRKELKGIQKFALIGVKPADDDRDRSALRAAIASHVWNGDVYAACMSMAFKDDIWEYEPSLKFNDISPSGKIEELKKAGIPIYSYSGWFDGAYQHAAIKRYLTIRNPGSKLVIGPWSHGGRYNAGPLVQDLTAFKHTTELLRFFDFYIKGKQTGIDVEAPIHYYTMIEEKWKACDAWPPAANNVTYYFQSNHGLDTHAPSDVEASDTYLPDYTATTGRNARWDTLFGGTPVTYTDRAEADRKLLTYTTAPLSVDTEVAGHPLVTLFISTTAPDGQFIVYLEDVDEKGNVSYVTEGELRGLCRKVSADPQPYADVVPYHSYLRKDAAPLTPGEITKLEFDLLPTSYLFKKGHAIRIAIAGADKDHFHPPYFPPDPVQYFREAAHPSYVVLPVVSR